MPSLLAVDLGLRTGLALYNSDGRLVWYRSKNFGTKGSLRRGVGTILDEIADLTYLVIEGGGSLAEIWEREAARRHLTTQLIHAPVWREQLLLPRQQQNAAKAKYYADQLARRVIEWSQISRPTALRHDAAEAILIGLWGVLHIGWLTQLPSDLKA